MKKNMQREITKNEEGIIERSFFTYEIKKFVVLHF